MLTWRCLRCMTVYGPPEAMWELRRSIIRFGARGLEGFTRLEDWSGRECPACGSGLREVVG